MEDPSGNKFFMDGAGNIEVNAPKNMTFTVGEDFNLSVGNNMNATIGNNHTMSVTNDNMLLVQNNHTLEANNYGQTLQGNYNQSIQGKKLVAVTGNMEETSAAYYHTAQSGNVIIQSANISKLLGKVDAFVNKSGFQKPRYFIEDVSDKREEKSEKQRGEQKKTLVQELHDDIIAKLKPANYTGNERKYVEGALKHIDFLVDENVNFVKEAIWSGLYDGKLNIKDDGETTRDDLKVTIFHEYLHHVNYMEKIYPYRYSDESKRKIFQTEDECYIFREATMDEVFTDYLREENISFNEEKWAKNTYDELEEKEKNILLNYRQKNIHKFESQCNIGIYRPSNYYRDELIVYNICLKNNKILFNMSEGKQKVYHYWVNDHNRALQNSVNYEHKKKYNEKGFLIMILILLYSIFNSTHIYGQVADSLVNNEYLTFKLNVDEKRLVSLEIENTTCDTLFVRTRLAIEKRGINYISGYEKRYKNKEGRDSIYFQWGVLWDYYGYTDDTQYIILFGERKKFFEKLPPKTSVVAPLTFFEKGEYYLRIQTMYRDRKKLYFAQTETNKIKID